MTGDQVHALYRFYGGDGSLLYIGITNNPGRRWAQHGRAKPWWHEVDRIELERYPTRAAVLSAEVAAIQAERPRHNVIHALGLPAAVSLATTAPLGPVAQPCECGRPGTYVFLIDHELVAHLRAKREWSERTGWAGADMTRLGRMTFTDWMDSPMWAAWRYGCDEHAPDDGAYGFRWPQTWPELTEWTAHLLETKPEWIGETTWWSVLRQATS